VASAYKFGGNYIRTVAILAFFADSRSLRIVSVRGRCRNLHNFRPFAARLDITVLLLLPQ
jgi:hypothetical protein